MNVNADDRRNATMATTTPAAPDRHHQVEEELVQAVLASFQDTRDPRLKELIQALASAGHGAGAHSPRRASLAPRFVRLSHPAPAGTGRQSTTQGNSVRHETGSRTRPS